MSGLKKLVAGNWKMNGLKASASQFEAIRAGIAGKAVDVAVCPPFTLVGAFAAAAEGSGLLVGAQDCHFAQSGAHTGDISAQMLADAGARAVIVGHSERRKDHGETDEMVARKAEAALKAGLVAIVCVGETLEERKGGITLQVVGLQLRQSLGTNANGTNTVIAYEPVWAIGTGLTPTTEEIAEVHAFIRKELGERFGAEGPRFRLLYGGSVAPGNAREIFAIDNVDGALVGGASLDAEKFLAVIAGAL